jgi:hypothetical protein
MTIRFQAALAALLLPGLPLPGAEITFVKSQASKAFVAEGIAVADVDGDGKKDLLAGFLWFKAPDWKPQELAKPKEFDPLKGYSESFCSFADDLNGDSRPDLIVVGFPGAPVRVHENPGADKLGAHWPEHQAFPSCTNESPAYTDLDGDGKRELVCGFEPEERMAWFSPGTKINDPWTCHPLTAPKAAGAQRFFHGLGIGDVNLDGRKDVLIANGMDAEKSVAGWYEAPEDRKAAEWKFHPAPFGPKSAHLHVHDFDGDGDQDVAGSSAHQYGIWWYEQGKGPDGAATWTAHEIDKEYSQTHALALADLNGDQLPDLVTGRRWMAHMGGDPGEKEGQPAVLHWYQLERKDGKATWKRHLIDGDSGVGTQFEVTDVDGDGLLDLAIANKKGVHFFQQKR